VWADKPALPDVCQSGHGRLNMAEPGNTNYLDTVLRRSDVCGKPVPVGPGLCVGSLG
jgi:hypothetical protein